MSASQSGGQGAQPPGGAADPSMEDILASIRRILSEDDAPAAGATPPAASHPAAAAPAAPADETDVFALDASMLVEPPAPHEDAPPDLFQEQPAPAAVPPAAVPPVIVPAAIVPPAIASPGLAPEFDPAGLVAPAAAAAAASSLGTLVRTLAERQSLAVYRGGPTLEDIVREEMRPMLKSWLDENLPPLVERLVRAEIERVVGRAAS